MRALKELGQIRAAFRDWPEIAAKGFLWKHLELPDGEIAIRSRRGTTIKTPLEHNVGALYAAVEVFALGAYESDWELEDSPLVVDIGANIGSWILWLAERRPRLRGVCYEPDPAAAGYLRSNLRVNQLDAQVEVRPEAVSDRTGTAPLYQERPGSGSSSLRPTSPVVQFDRETLVPTISFAEAIERVSGEISVIKIDCEGAEYEIVESGSTESWRRIRRVVMEYHPTRPDGYDALLARVAQMGFVVTKEDRRAPGLGTLWLARNGG